MTVLANAYTATVVLLALIVAVVVLTWHGSIGGEAAVGFLTGIAGLFGGAAANAHGVRQGAKAAVDPPPEN